MKLIMDWFKVDERRTALYSIQDIMALTAPKSKSVTNLSISMQRFTAMEMNLTDAEAVNLTPGLRQHIFETQAKEFPCLKPYFDQRIVVLARDYECHRTNGFGTAPQT